MQDERWDLIRQEGRLCLVDRQKPGQAPLCCDFSTGPFLQRLKSFGKQQPLARAVQVDGAPTAVLDLTAGLGVDGVTLAHWGCKMTLIERSPYLFALLEDGLNRAKEVAVLKEAVARICLIQSEATTYLKNLKERPAVIYLDPMFPLKKKSALPPREMQILRTLLGDDSDFEQTLSAALTVAISKVVVKRPDSAEEPEVSKPSHTIGSKLVRFEIYRTGH